jgi:hypothetical protein
VGKNLLFFFQVSLSFLHCKSLVPGIIGILQALEAIKVAIGSAGKSKKVHEQKRNELT